MFASITSAEISSIDSDPQSVSWPQSEVFLSGPDSLPGNQVEFKVRKDSGERKRRLLCCQTGANTGPRAGAERHVCVRPD